MKASTRQQSSIIHFLLFSLVQKWISCAYSVETTGGEGADDDQALLERLAKREERRQKRMKEALERQKDLDQSASTNGTELPPSLRQRDTQEEEEKQEEEKPAQEDVADADTDRWRKGEEDKKEDEKVSKDLQSYSL